MPKPRSVGLQTLGWLSGMLFAVTGWISYLLGYGILVAMVGVTGWTTWHWFQDMKRMLAEGEAAKVNNHQLTAKLRSIEQERDDLQAQITEQGQTVAPRSGELKGLCLHLSEELSEFIAKRQMMSESVRFWQQSQNAETQEERDRLRAEEWRAMPHDATLTKKLYHEKYQERVMAVYEVLAQHAWLGPDQRHYFEEPANDTQIQIVAELLEDVGNKL